ncbi:MAG: glycosyl transferase family 2 [Frankiales bacterium]|nr:glycosyl transferase family 2 [Frankiales bacterium]
MTGVSVSVIVLAYGTEEFLSECVEAALGRSSEDVEVIVVDNGASVAVAALGDHPRLRVEQAARNLGYAGGCNYGAGFARGDTFVFLNSDAVVEPEAVRRLAEAANEPGVGLASGDIRLAAKPDTMNSAGNPVHFLGIVWAGSFGEPAIRHTTHTDVATASGAFLAVSRAVWNKLGGFNETYFAYHEDAELSLRAWQRGWRVVFVPGAAVRHHYEFSRNPGKQYLLERNRWITVLTTYPRPVLARVLPAMLAFDVALTAVAAVQGWLPAKLKSWAWLVGHVGYLRRRRREVQAANEMEPMDFAGLLATRIEPAMIERPPGLGPLNAVLSAYWRLASHGLSR